MSTLVILVFRFYGTKKITNNDNKYLLAYFLPLFFLIEWFLYHPAMRYGGFVLVALPFFVFTSIYLEKFSFNKKKIYFGSVILIILTIFIFNTRNIVRINKEKKFTIITY